MMSGTIQDVRFALRQLRKSMGFACTAILVPDFRYVRQRGHLWLCGCRADQAVCPTPTRLVEVTERVAMIPRANLSYPDYLDWKKLNQVFSSMDVYSATGYLLRTPAGAEAVPGVRVSDGFFHTLGITPVLGRDFYVGEDTRSAQDGDVELCHMAETVWRKQGRNR